MLHSPKISVIIPVYNRAEWLEEAVQSAFATRYANLEILIIDDGSIDESFNVARKLATKYAGKVMLLQHPDKRNHGVGSTKNLGIQAAAGKYICFLDSDDLILPNRFEASLKILESDDTVDGVYDWAKTEFLPGGESRVGTVRPIISFESKNPADVLGKILNEGKHWAAHAITLRKDVLEKVGGFSVKLPRCEDLVLWLKLACVARLVKGTEIPVAVYRIHTSNISTIEITGITITPLLAYIEAYRWAKKHQIDKKKKKQLRDAIFGKTFFVCGRYRRANRPHKGILLLLRVACEVPSLAFRKLFWGNLLFSLREGVGLNFESQ